MDIRLRYAPSPTGNLHIGGARTALFCFLYARKNKGKFILRIEDTDIKRNINNGEKSQIKNLEWLGVEIDETIGTKSKYGPYRQTERLDLYTKYVNQLLKEGKAYKCYCTKEELDAQRKEQLKKGVSLLKHKGCQSNASKKKYSIRIKISNQEKKYKWNDLVRGNISFKSSDFNDFVIMKSNGIPTYNFAVVIDDFLMKISHVFRGEEHISNTPKQLIIYDAFGWKPPKFAHMTLIIDETGKKLSKRNEKTMQFIEQYKNKGYLPQAIFNFLSLLGWSPKNENEIFTKEQLIKIFDVEGLSKSSSFFDNEKLLWMNSQYIKNLSNETYLQLVLPFLEKKYGKTNLNCDVALLFKQQIKFGEEIISLSEMFYKYKTMSKEDKKTLKLFQWKKVQKILLKEIDEIDEIDDWNIYNLEKIIKKIQINLNLEGKNLFMPIRLLCTNQSHGPDLKNTIFLLGKQKVLKYIREVD